MDSDGDMSSESASPTSAEIALRNPLILDTISKFSGTEELKAYRQVHRTWCDAATKELRRRQSLKCRRHFTADLNAFKSEVSSSTFPAKIYEWDFGDKRDRARNSVADFLKRLKVFTDEEPPHSSGVVITLGARTGSSSEVLGGEMVFAMVEQILTGVKNIVTLTLDLTSHDPDSAIDYDYWLYSFKFLLPQTEIFNLKLDSGKSYRWDCQHLWWNILQTTPNIKEVKGANNDMWRILLRHNRAHLLKSVQVDLVNRFDKIFGTSLPNELPRLSDAVPGLESFELPDVGCKYHRDRPSPFPDWRAVAYLLARQNGNLKTMKIPQLSYLDLFADDEEPDLPIFQNLKYLELKNSRVFPLLPRRMPTTTLFPQLYHVKLDLKGCFGNHLQQYFSADGGEYSGFVTLPLVRKLELSCSYNKKGMQILAQVFPNVTEITLHQEIGKFHHSRWRGIWDVSRSVESLTLHFHAVKFRGSKLRKFDEMFTGLSKNMLKSSPADSAAEPQLRIASRNGIRRLAGLKLLRIIFDVNEEAVHRSILKILGSNERISRPEIVESIETPFFVEKGAFTHLSRLYAFEPATFSTCFYYDGSVHCAPQIRKFLEPLLTDGVSLDPYYGSAKSEGLKTTLAAEARRHNIAYPIEGGSGLNETDGAAEGHGSDHAEQGHEDDVIVID